MPCIEIALDSIPMNTPHRVVRDDQAIVVVRNGRSLVAFHDRCPHAGWRLSDGQLVDGMLECPGHGWQFDLRTGRSADVPDFCLARVRCVVAGERARFEWEEEVCPFLKKAMSLLWAGVWLTSSSPEWLSCWAVAFS